MRYFLSLIAIFIASLATADQGIPMTHWQASKISPAKAVVALLHGLNNTPQVMDPLAIELNKIGFHTLRLSLSGHRGDSSEADSARWIAETAEVLYGLRNEFPDLPIYAVGFSVGAATLIATIEKHQTIILKKAVLLAPAISLRGFTNLIRPILPLALLGAPGITLMPESYRAERFPPLQFYKALFNIVDLIQEPKKTASTEAKIFLARNDEFVSFDETAKWIKKNNLSWEIVELKPKPEFKGSFEHLIIDQPSLGKDEWQKLLSEIGSFFCSTNNPS